MKTDWGNGNFLSNLKIWWSFVKQEWFMKRRAKKIDKFFESKRDEAMERMSAFFKTPNKLSRYPELKE